MASDLVTYYVYASVVVYGFFALGLLTEAKLFFGASSPMCYWTTMDASGEWFARACGLLMLFTLASPFYAGVAYSTFVKVSLPINVFYTGLFVYAAFFLEITGPEGCEAPMADMNMWIPQIGLGVGFTIWNVLALEGRFNVERAPASDASTFCHAMAFLYAVVFGSTLMIAPGIWGPGSVFEYWSVLDGSGDWFGRALGVTMVSVFLAPFYAGLSYDKLAVMALPMNIFWLPLFAKCAFFMDVTGPGANAILPINLWLPQVFISLLLLVWNITVLKGGKGFALI